MASDANLIRGERELRRMTGVGVVNTTKNAGQTIADAWKVLSDERAAINKKTQDYIDSGEVTIDEYGIPDVLLPSIAAWNVEHRNNYKQHSLKAATFKGKRGDESREVLNAEKATIANGRKSVTALQEWSDNFLNNYEAGEMSKIDSPADLDFLSDIATYKTLGYLDDKGYMVFKKENGETVKFGDLPKLFNKSANNGIVSGIAKMAAGAEKGGALLIKPENGFDVTEQGVRSLLNGATRKSIMSLAVDDYFGTKGGLGLDPELVYDESRQEELKEAVVVAMDQMIRDTAKASYDKKEVADDVSSPEGKDTDYRNYIAKATNRVELMRDKDDWGELSQGNYKFKGKAILETRRVGNYLVIVTEGNVRVKFDLGQPEAYRHIRAIVTGGIKNHWAERQALGTDWTGTVLTEQKANSKEKSSGGNTEVHVTSEGATTVKSNYGKGPNAVGANAIDLENMNFWENGQ
jgi:hypothetical protein